LKKGFIFAKTSTALFYYDVIKYFAEKGIELVEVWDDECRFTVVLGGDGSVLGASRQAHQYPIFVINTGHLGFLTSCSKENYRQAIDAFLEGHFTSTVRKLLELTIGDKKFTALNDVVIKDFPTGDGLARLVELSLYAGDELVCHYRADGLIVSTPTGSTAYNLSANGPIVHPNCISLFVVTPICPQGLSQRPLILPARYGTEPITLRVKSDDCNLFATIDGQIGYRLQGQDALIKFDGTSVEVVNPDLSYFEILQKKLGWGYKLV